MQIPTMELELIGEVNIYLGLGIQVVTALFLGGMVGFDREQKMKAAGLKTNILICIGACLYTTISMIVTKEATGVIDPNRVAAQIVSGIGFLGAGAIIQGRGHVIGLTTAATIWVVAAIGYTIGAGYPIAATFFSVTVLLVLKLINPLNSLFEKSKDFKYYHVEILSRGSSKRATGETIFREEIELDEMYEEVVDKEKNKRILHVYLTSHPRAMERIISEVNESIKVEKVTFKSIERPVEELVEVSSDD
jgi:putative Mg2+ transporter-C (MgtC) family protein